MFLGKDSEKFLYYLILMKDIEKRGKYHMLKKGNPFLYSKLLIGVSYGGVVKMKKEKFIKILFVFSIFLVSLVMAGSINLPIPSDFPAVGSTSWGNPLLISHNKTLDTIRVLHTENGTLKAGINGSFLNLNVTGILNVTYAYFNDTNITNDLNVFGNIYGEIPNSFKNTNFSEKVGENITIGSNTTIGSATSAVNMTLFSLDGTLFRCGVSNDGTFSCS